MIFVITKSYSQNYNISFAGTGAATTVDSVKVENLNQGTTLTMSGSDILHLGAVGINDINTINETIKVYPNPMQGQAEISFYAKETGTTQVFIYDINGKVVVNSIVFLTKALHKYQVSGLKQGMYFINIIGDNYAYTTKLVSQYTSQNEAKLTYLSNENPLTSLNTLKSTNAIIDMPYTTGDNLRFTGYAGIFTSIVTDIPSSSKTITFNFVVNCGNFTLMHTAGNIAPVTKTITYHTVSTTLFGATPMCAITQNLGANHSADSVNDASESSAGWYWQFNRLQAYKHDGVTRTPNISWINPITENSNWTTSNDPCILLLGSAWRLPTITEWTNANTSWINYNNTYASELKIHASGALNYIDGEIAYRASKGYYGSSTQYSSSNSDFLYLNWNGNSIGNITKALGVSVRCIRDINTQIDFPSLITNPIISITTNSATSGGSIISDGGATITAKGICFSNTTNPLTTNSVVNSGSGTATFASNLTGLTANTTYYVRAFAMNSVGTAYGNQLNFTTNPIIQLAILTTTDVTAISSTSASSGGNISSDGGATITARGICYSTTTNPTTSNSIVNNGSGSGNFISNMNGLIGLTTYYVKAFATNNIGTAYGNQLSFTTSSSVLLPTLTTDSITNITVITATSGGNISADGGSSVTARGLCYSTTVNPSTSNNVVYGGIGTGVFTLNISGLTGNTTYYVRAYAENIIGIAYGNERNFTTMTAQPPTIITTTVSAIKSTSAFSGGNVTSEGGYSVTQKGICWSILTNPLFTGNHTVNGNGSGSFAANISGLSPNTTYYVRAYAINSVGTGYGNSVSFITQSVGSGAVIDYDGNIYDTVHIGTQIWLKQNLKVTHYRNGDSIPNITNSTQWASLSTAAYCWHSNDSATYKNTSGALYNFYTVTDIRNLCPLGWHVPTDNEWNILKTYLGGDNLAGNKLKETGTTHWYSSNPGVTNESGFTALPGGSRTYEGNFINQTWTALWWSSSQYYTSIYAWLWGTATLDNYWFSGSSDRTNNGFSIRCLKDTSLLVSLPLVTTINITSITPYSAAVKGNVVLDGGLNILVRGVCYNTNSSPTIANNIVLGGSGAGQYMVYATNLTPNTIYYTRAYATNNIGISYGNELTFTTTINIELPVITTSPPTSVTINSAVSGGNVISDGGAFIADRGICYSLITNPTTADTIVSCGTGIGLFTANLTGLTANTTYYVRAYAINSIGTAYGSTVNFGTDGGIIQIGQYYQGGKIAYILQAGDPGYDVNVTHGLIAAASDQGSAAWQGSSTIIPGADGTAIGTGNQNTLDIIYNCMDLQIAAKKAHSININGYADWYLPSKDELKKLYINRALIGGFALNIYWSSSEYSYENACAQSFSDGYQFNVWKFDTWLVRAVRSF